MTSVHDLSQAFKALSNPNRLQMYLELLQQRQTVVESGPACERCCGLTELMTKLNL